MTPHLVQKLSSAQTLRQPSATIRPISRIAAPPRRAAGGDGLRALSISSKRFGTTDWFVIHHKGEGPELLTPDAIAHLRAEFVPVMIFAANAAERDLMLDVLTRHLEDALPVPIERRGRLEVGELTIDQDAHRVAVDGVDVVLTSMEFKLLVTLIERRDAVQSRAVLLRDVWHQSARSRTRTIDTHVKRLRDKLGTAARFFHSVRGVGYRFSETPRAASAACGAESRPSLTRVGRSAMLETG